MYANLRDFWVQEGDEGERPEGLWDEYIRDLAELGEVIAQVVGAHVLGAATHEHLTGHLLNLALLLNKRSKTQ